MNVTEHTDVDRQVQEHRVRLERLLAERTAELYDSERRWRTFFDLPMVGTAITSRSKGWIAVNDETCRILGYPRDELFRTSWAELTHPDDLAADVEQFERMLRREIDGYTLEKRFIHKDGCIVHTILSGGCGAIGDATPDTFYVTILDVTDRRLIEAELAAAREREQRMAEEARATLEKKLKTSLNAAAIAHEINQPLSRVILRARMGLETATGADRDRLAALVADAERVVLVIEKMKVLLRNVETVQHEVDLAAVTASALHQVKRPLREAGVTVVRQGLERGCLVLGDEVQLQMILINLLTNAIEAIVAACALQDFDLLLLDVGLPDGNGLHVARAFLKRNPQGKVIVVTGHASSFVCPAWLDANLQAVISKNDTFQSLSAELDELLSRSQPNKGAATLPVVSKPLTKREAEVFALLGEGLSSREIAARLRIVVHTVLTYRKRLAKKLGTRGMELMTQAVAHRAAFFGPSVKRP